MKNDPKCKFCYALSSPNLLLVATDAGHYERPPYNEQTIRSVYHVRHYDVLKLMHVKEPLDIFLSHDWPLGITEYGNWQELIRAKNHFEAEVMSTGLRHRLMFPITYNFIAR